MDTNCLTGWFVTMYCGGPVKPDGTRDRCETTSPMAT
jgi:hypothetical protein